MDVSPAIGNKRRFMSALLSANEIRLTYGYQTLLDGVTLAIAAGEKAGMVGRNGCGKTSLLKILTGQQMADSGEISLRRADRVEHAEHLFMAGLGGCGLGFEAGGDF
jgi:ATPase subunit of ABC transporter with duplicated ATPase domains